MSTPTSPAFRGLIDSLVGTAFSVIGDLNEPGTYRRPSSTYNPSTGGMVLNNLDTVLSNLIVTRFGDTQKDSLINVLTDFKAILPASQIAFPPAIGDQILLTSSGRVFNVIRDLTPPGNSLLTLHVRES